MRAISRRFAALCRREAGRGKALAAASALLISYAAFPASAGDFANREIIGFTPDGAQFAFEEFGVQDGSGFPYCNIFVIDTETDSWHPGTPVRRLVEDEGVRVATVCGTARSEAAPILAGIDDRGSLLASNPITESGRDPYSVTFKRHPEQLLPNPDWTLRLEKIALPAQGQPLDDGEETFGFRLTLETPDGKRVLHEDSVLPPSRGVALDYRIHDVVIRQPFGQPSTLAVLVMVLRKGFEGPDGRYLAVTAKLPS